MTAVLDPGAEVAKPAPKFASPGGHPISFIIVDRKHERFASYGAAAQERDRLQELEDQRQRRAGEGARTLLVMATLNISGEELAGKILLAVDPTRLNSFALDEAGRVWDRCALNPAVRRGEMMEAVRAAISRRSVDPKDYALIDQLAQSDIVDGIVEDAVNALADLPAGGDSIYRAQEAIRAFIEICVASDAATRASLLSEG